MKEVTLKFLDRLSKYDWFTVLLPGIFFVILAKQAGSDIRADSWYENFFLAFFAGIVCSRIGATVVEWVAKRKALGLFSQYSDYLDWQKSDPEGARMLVRNSNWFRSLSGMVLALMAMKAVNAIAPKISMSAAAKQWLGLAGLLILFCDSYRRQLSFTKQRIDKHKTSQKK